MKRRLGRGLRDLAAAPFPSAAPHPPASRDQAPVAASGPRPTIVCVTSGKGGTGKSVLTSNLAVHLAASGIRVLAIDADMGLANLHILLGMRPRRTVLEVIDRGAGLDDIAEVGPVGLRLAAGGSGVAEVAD